MTEINVPIPQLQAAVQVRFQDVGLSSVDAGCMAQCLLWAETRGIHSHGLEKLPRYLDLLASGAAKADACPTFRALRGGAGLVKADWALGPVAMSFAINEAVRLAREHAVAWVAVRDTLHAGAIGCYAEQAAREGMIAIVLLAGMPTMAWPGVSGAALATSPIAIAVPNGTGDPLLLDMATASIALGQIAIHRKRGELLPEGAALDKAGQPTTDPALAVMPTAMAGVKGAGLSLMIEILTSVLSGAPVLAPFHAQAPGSRRHRQNASVIVVDLAAWGQPEIFAKHVAETVAALKAMPTQDHTALRMPGERGTDTRVQCEQHGVPIVARLWAELRPGGMK